MLASTATLILYRWLICHTQINIYRDNPLNMRIWRLNSWTVFWFYLYLKYFEIIHRHLFTHNKPPFPSTLKFADDSRQKEESPVHQKPFNSQTEKAFLKTHWNGAQIWTTGRKIRNTNIYTQITMSWLSAVFPKWIASLPQPPSQGSD